MEEEKQDFDLQLLVVDVYMNYEKLNKQLSKKYPHAFAEFNQFAPNSVEYPYCYFQFFYSFRLSFHYKETDVINQKFLGTYSYRIIFDKHIALQLSRTRRNFSYYGINSKQKAIEKLITKAFEIVECLLVGKEMPEKQRRS